MKSGTWMECAKAECSASRFALWRWSRFVFRKCELEQGADLRNVARKRRAGNLPASFSFSFSPADAAPPLLLRRPPPARSSFKNNCRDSLSFFVFFCLLLVTPSLHVSTSYVLLCFTDLSHWPHKDWLTSGPYHEERKVKVVQKN